MQTRILVGAITVALAACGGGSGDSGSSNGGTPSPAQFLVSTVAGSGGTISPVSALVSSGQTTSFTVTPATGFQIGDVSGCGGSLSGQTYTTGAVTAACTVTASFVAPRYTVSAVAGNGGSVSPVSQQVAAGRTATVVVQPNSGFQIGNVSGCNGSLTGNSYLTGPVTADCQVTASFSTINYQVTVDSGSGGKASIASQSVAGGTVVTVSFTPDSGFVLSYARGCGGVLRDNVLTTAPVTAPCTIEARFNSANQVVLADANLASAIRSALNLPAGAAISKSQAAQLTNLQANGLGVSDLKGLEYFTGLTSLALQDNKISDLYPLRTLSQLNRLELNSNAAINDISPLQGLSQLRTLWLFNNAVTNLSPLQGLALTELGLQNSTVLDLTPLLNMPLQRFYLFYSDTSDLSPLANAPLRYMDLTGSKVSSLNALNNLSRLTTLLAKGTNLSEISALRQATALTRLTLDGTKVTDIATLQALNYQNNAELSISGCLDTTGYSRHVPALQSLASSKSLRLTIGDALRRDCPDTWGGTGFTGSATVQNRTLNYNWQVSNYDQPLQCALYLDLDDQLPGEPVVALQDCAMSGERLYSGRNADQFRATLLFDNGIGGEKLLTLGAEVGSPPSNAQLQSMDLSQLTISAKPRLVPEREGLLRLHVTAAQSPAVLPVVQVQASLNGSSQTFTAKAPAQLPLSKVHRSLADSYSLRVPSAWMQSGLQLTALLDGQVVQTLTPRFAAKLPLAIRLVPLQLGSKVATLPTQDFVRDSIKTFWPFQEVDVRVRAPYQLTATGSSTTANQMLQELRDLQAIEGGVYYYGYFKPEMGDGCCGGLGYIGYPAAVGFDTDRDGTILAHELGHNFGRQHVDCGNPSSPDNNYPYAGNRVGSVGLSLDLSSWRSPDEYKDVMSYCAPKHVSDYNVAAVQDFIEKSPPPPFSAAASATESHGIAAQQSRSLFVSGNFSGNEIQLRTVVPVNRAPRYVAMDAEGRLSARVQDTLGIWYQFNAQQLQIDHPSAGEANDFVLELPYLELQRLELWRGDELLASTGSAAAKQSAATQGSLQEGGGAKALQQTALNQDAHTFSQSNNIANLSVAATSTLVDGITLNEQQNQVCVKWPAASGHNLTLIHRSDVGNASEGTTSGATVLALNERTSEFCRASDTLPAGGEWRLIWRSGLTVREFSQKR